MAIGIAITVLAADPGLAIACPFCSAVRPTLAQQRESAVAVAIVEVQSAKEPGAAEVRVHQSLKGRLELDAVLTVASPVVRSGDLGILFGARSTSDAVHAGAVEFVLVPASEVAILYFARSPDLRKPAAERLKYFAGYLEHRDSLVAEDAFGELGQARYSDIVAAAEHFSMPRLRSWLTDAATPPARHGVYAMLLGLAIEKADRRENQALLRKLIERPADDFRAGFDGLFAGYVLLAGQPGLDWLSERYLDNPKTPDGDLRHLQRTLRFLHEESVGVSRTAVCAATRKLLARPEFAASVLTDLARWNDWSLVAKVAAWYDEPGYQEPATRAAMVGYLLACPDQAAASVLAELRTRDPKGVAAAEASLDLGSVSK